MKTRKILGIVVLTLVLTLALGIAAYAAEVSTQTELTEAIASASTDSANPTEIVLKNDINVSQSFAMSGTSTAKKYIILSGDYTIKLSAKRGYWPEGGGTGRGVVIVENADVTIKDVKIDANYGGGSYANCLFVGSGATVTLKGTATLKNGGKFGSSKGSALGVKGGTFIMEDNSLITGASCSSSSSTSGDNASVVYVWNNGKFIMNGGEISGNKAGSAGLIYVATGNSTVVELNAGRIVNNTYNNTSKDQALRYTASASYSTSMLRIGGEMEIEGKIYYGSDTTKITSALKDTLTFAYAYGKASNAVNVNVQERQMIVGEDYTLTVSDLNRIVAPDGYTLYLCEATNSINWVQDGNSVPSWGIEQTEGIIPDEITEEIDAEGETRELSANETVTIAETNLLKNATIDATEGEVVIGTTTITGIMSFDNEGNMVVNTGNKVTMETAENNGVKSVGIVCSEKYDTAADTRTLTITTANGTFTDVYNTANITGNFLFNAIIHNVPVATDAASFTVTIQ